MDAAFSHFPTLDTDRLRLRAVRQSDLDALFAIFSDAEVMAFYGSPRHETPDETQVWLDRLFERYERHEALRWGITLAGDDTLIGTVSLHHFGPGRTEIGYDLSRACWGRGIMTEAMTAVLDYIFGSTTLHRIEAIIDIDNAASKALLLKLGFTYEGNLRQRYPEGDGFADEHYFSLLRDEWRG